MTPPTLSERKRTEILQAALETFRREGFHAASMDLIAERASVSKRTLYNHFPSKDALFDTVIDGCWQRFVRPEDPAFDPNILVHERLAALARSRMNVLLDPELLAIFRMVLAESMRMPDLGRAYRRDQPHLELLGVKDLLQDEVSRGRLFIEDVDLAATHFWGLVFEGLFWPVVLLLQGPTGPTERDRIISEGITTFLARYGNVAKTQTKPNTSQITLINTSKRERG